ncbi:MAG TPA: glycosyltransferase [Dongiaceae bacterium]|nr:glycosyltransferase [Dongiaceae bacterium]
MLRNRLYYRIKPLVPLSARLAIRRWFALRKREHVREAWPVLPGSERPPEGWPGWRDGKQFAFVLTHDVEGAAGLAKVRKLMALEQKLGFRSAFNFIPEGGQYSVSKGLRDELAANGFEVGVHDLHHDGKLFLTKREFDRNAVKINRYLKDWGAAGFRSGFMLHNLDWIHDLNIQYDASTFDTDPFEPQPHGQDTIFPFWVQRNAECRVQNAKPPSSLIVPASSVPSGGYVELPYTLPQDSTLFLILAERHPDIWLQKLDWIARHGGMALVNVHPDYIRFEGEPASPRTFPAEFYALFLEYARKRYGGVLWQALPRETAALVAEHPCQPRAKPRRVCMVTYSEFLSDTRVMHYAEALAERGDHVDVVGLRPSPDSPARETLGNINVVNLQTRFGRREHSLVSFLMPVLRFLAVSSWWITRQHARKRYDLLHVHNVPDFLVFGAWYPKLTGAKIILDIHDIVPEFYACKFSVREDALSIKLLKTIERASARFADHVIIANHLWFEKYAARTGSNGKCSVRINNVDAKVFRPHMRTRAGGRPIVIFPGSLQWHQGLDIAIRALPKVKAELPDLELHIYGDGNMKKELVALAQELRLNGSVRFFDPVSAREVAGIMANADLGIVPKRADSFGNEAYSTKIMEFMSLGVPAVVSGTKIDRYYFNDSVVRFFESGNQDALAQAMLEVLRDADLRRRLVANASAYAAQNSWDSCKHDYLALVNSLIPMH